MNIKNNRHKNVEYEAINTSYCKVIIFILLYKP